MATLISENELRQIIQEGKIIINGVDRDAEGIKYDFRFGNHFLKSYFSVPANFNELQTPDEKKNACVEPGEVVFVMSQERLALPNDMFIQLSPKRSMAQDGIELLGGLTVDPGYEGCLIFGLHNVSGTPFQLRSGIKLVGANFYRLSETELPSEGYQRPKAIEDFPERLQELIGKYKPVNPQTISAELKKLQTAFSDSQKGIAESLSEVKMSLSDMKRELATEIGKREQENNKITTQLASLERKMELVNETNIRHDQSLISLKDEVRTTKEDLKSEIRELKQTVGNVNQMFISIKTWTRIIAALMAVGGTIIAGLVTGVLQKLFI